MSEEQILREIHLSDKEQNPYYASTIEGNYGFFLRSFFRLLFSRIKLSSEETKKIHDKAKEGLIVYTLKSRSDLESLLYHFQYEQNGLPSPVFACDGTMTIFHSIPFFIRTTAAKFSFLFKHGVWMSPYRTGYIEHLIRSGKSLTLYIRDTETLRKRFIGSGRDPLVRVIQAQKEIERPIYLVPQMVIWEKGPERTKKQLSEIILRGRANPSGMRVLINFVRYFREAFITQAEPLNLKEYLREHPEREADVSALQIRQLLLDRLNKEKRVIVGPVAKSRQEIMEKVLFNDLVKRAIDRRMKKNGKPIKAIRKEAYKFINEIAADYNIFFIRLWGWIIRWALKHVFDGIEIDRKGLERVREEARRSTLVLVPCHKSHMDYMIISYIFFINNLFPPHIAAGMNLSFWPFGTLFRKSGAFFIRRSFRGSILYPALFTQYIHVLIEEGYPIEFFIEGGRSRSGKMVLPKLGFLSILINGYRAGCCEDLSFVPIAINYDRVMEEKAYLREIEGQEKPKESLRGVIRSLSVIKKRFGKIYINFDDPISLKGYLKGLNEKKESPLSIKKHAIPYYLAYKIANRINRVMMVVPTFLTAAAILAVTKRGFSMNHLREVSSLFLDYLRHEEVNMTESLSKDENLDYALKETLEIFLDEKIIGDVRLEREERAEEDDPLFELNDKNRNNLEYYKNNLLHFLLPIAFVSVSLLSRKRNSIDLEGIKEDFSFMQNLFINDFVFPPDEGNDRFIESTLKYLLEKGLIRENNGCYLIQSRHLEDLLHFASLVQSSFEAYYIVGSSLKYIYRRRLPEWRFMRRVRSTGEKMLQTGEIQRAESLSNVSYQNAVQFLIDQKIILRHKDRGLIEGTYYTLTQERKKIYWKKAKDFLAIYP